MGTGDLDRGSGRLYDSRRNLVCRHTACADHKIVSRRRIVEMSYASVGGGLGVRKRCLGTSGAADGISMTARWFASWISRPRVGEICGDIGALAALLAPRPEIVDQSYGGGNTLELIWL